MENDAHAPESRKPLSGNATNEERLCWRPWPCAACGGGVTPIGIIRSGSKADPDVPGSSPEELAAFQIELLRDWIAGCSHLGQEQVDLPKVAEGSEHTVFISEKEARVFKRTLPHVYGDSYYLVNGLVHQRVCSPEEYLVRMHLWKGLFGPAAAPIPLGITDRGQFISEQKFIVGRPPTQAAVDEFLETSGLAEVKRKCWLWKKIYPKFEVWVGDARDENFVDTALGIVPIDIRLWVVEP